MAAKRKSEKCVHGKRLPHSHAAGVCLLPAKKVKGPTRWWTREEFIAYLRETLIPDLRESGRDATADDFQTAIEFMEER